MTDKTTSTPKMGHPPWHQWRVVVIGALALLLIEAVVRGSCQPLPAEAVSGGRAAPSDPSDADAEWTQAFSIARQAELRGDVWGAINGYRHVLALAPHLSQAHMNLGNLLETVGNAAGGLHHMRRAFAVAKEQQDTEMMAGAMNNVGLMLQRAAGRRTDLLEEAARAYEASYQLRPTLMAMYNLARVRYAQVTHSGGTGSDPAMTSSCLHVLCVQDDVVAAERLYDSALHLACCLLLRTAYCACPTGSLRLWRLTQPTVAP